MFFLTFHLNKILFEIKFQKKLIITFVLIFLTININAQPALSFHHLTSADGLTSNIIGHIFQDSRGFLWISTEDGLNMYDGETIKQYYLSDFIPETYNNYTGTIGEDIDHNILIAAKAGIAKFSWNDKKFALVYKNNWANYGNLFPELFVDKSKNIWINERIRIKEFDPHFHLLHTWNLRNNTNKYLNGPSNTFLIGEDVFHNIWVNDFDSAFQISAVTGKINSMVNSHLCNLNTRFKRFTCLSVSGNSIWIIANDFTLIHLNANFKLIASYELPHSIFPYYYNNVVEQNGIIWLGTFQDGIFRIDGQTGQVRQSKTTEAPNGLTSNYTSCITGDESKNIWIGTRDGINECQSNKSFFQWLNFNIPDPPSAQQYSINTIFTENNLLYVFTSFGAIQSQWLTNTSQYFIYKKNYFTSAFPFNGKWIVSNSHHIDFWEIKNNRIIYSPFVSPHPSILDSTGVVSFYKDHNKNIWMGLLNDAGIICWNTLDNSFDYYSQKNAGRNYCPLRHFKYALEDSKGNIWMGYEKGGIAIFDKEQQRFISQRTFEKGSINNVAVTGMINDQQNHIWIATNSGLICYNESKDSYRIFTRKDGLPSNDITGIAQGETGNIWAGFEGALASINLSTNVIATYSSSNGLHDEQFQNPFYDPVSKTMFFCTDRDVVYFDPYQIKKILSSLNPVITSFQVMGKEQPFFAGKKLELPFSQNYLSFNFSAPNFINASENEYECKLNGVDKDWIFLGNRHFANYSQLQPGNYVFQIRARVKDGKWQESSSAVIVSILTPFWRTTWFQILCVVLSLFIIFSFVYARLKNKLEKQILAQSIRDKIAGDLHDDIRSTLSSISIFSELAKREPEKTAPLLENISRNTSLMQENMSDIVWAINPKNDRFGNIIQRMSQFAAELLESKNMIVNFESALSLSSLSLQMEERKNFYLIFKEAINNCAKYSEAEHVNILVSSAYNQINLIIEDDGKGFDNTKQYAGNGISSMKKRAALLNGILQIDSEKDKGTTVKLNFKI